ncbi:MFS family permease [Haloferula luteola]|uniref:MFS family permease n=1 Tax=Haloferula luteola TaxID=595692 RepID=A0A840VD83_9BACT|nr:MFS transporter [Haloferula luteola]MBB5352588.1 MFS family permease [Haloferula luteola]
MIFRFSLYGFLKNLRFFEAFLILALRERGFDFLAIGTLISIREITTHILEIPSGAAADAWGRKLCMVGSMSAYVACFLLLGAAQSFAPMAIAMVLYGLGDAFRSGTHKAMIYTWLRSQGREKEKTAVYGYTRSWSKMGSAISALIAAALVTWSGNYASVFYWSALPSFLNVVNLASYPKALDGGCHGLKKGLFAATWQTLVDSFREFKNLGPLRRLVGESVAIEGSYEVVKDYLQPVLQTAALTLPVMAATPAVHRTAWVTGITYAVVFAAGSAASRRAHRWESTCGGNEPATRHLLLLSGIVLALVPVTLIAHLPWLAAGGFVALGLMQNLWRPIHVGRFDENSSEGIGATVLSVEAQAKSVAAAVWAPLLGACIDASTANSEPLSPQALWPIGLPALPLLIAWLCRRPAKMAPA